jgi:hypothetical protein
MRKTVSKKSRVTSWIGFAALAALLGVGIEPVWTLYQQASLAYLNDKWISQVAKTPNISMRDVRLLLNQFLYRRPQEMKVVISLVRQGGEGTANAGQLIVVKRLEDGYLPATIVQGDKAAVLFDPHKDYAAIDPDNDPALRVDKRFWPKSLTLPPNQTVWVTEVHIKRRPLTSLGHWLPFLQLPGQLFCYSYF